MSLAETFASWGVPDQPVVVSARARRFLTAQVGAALPTPPVPIGDIAVPPSRLSTEAQTALVAVLGAEHVDVDRTARLAHAGGLSYIDLVRRRGGDVADAPDAVLRPATHDEVLGLLRVCADQRIAVVPFGGGTSVVGGVAGVRGPFGAVVSVAFDRMAALLDVDPESGLVTVEPGITGPVLERLLGARGLTLGHLPQSWTRATIGGYVATRSAGQASSGYGRSDEMVESLRMATPAGTLEVGRVPASAAGPDLRQLLIGSEGVFGIITAVTLRVRHRPTHTRYEAVVFPSYAAGLACFRDLAQHGLRPDVMRLSDPIETTANLALSNTPEKLATALHTYLRARGAAPWPTGSGAMAILGWEARSSTELSARRTPALDMLSRHKGVRIGRRAGESWRHGRFAGPYLRDALMDQGYLVETLETATRWRDLHRLHDAVAVSLHTSLSRPGLPGPMVMSHVSHVYETGGSLYVTVLAAADPADPAAQWRTAKTAATQTIVDHGGTLTHHHSVGVDHAPWLPREIGDLGVGVLRAVKARLDPDGILNPGKLLPSHEEDA